MVEQATEEGTSINNNQKNPEYRREVVNKPLDSRRIQGNQSNEHPRRSTETRTALKCNIDSDAAVREAAKGWSTP